jgi:protein TonB
MAAAILKTLSPRSASGAFALSVLTHVVLYGAIIGAISYGATPHEPPDATLDLGYQTFDEPPQPEKKEQQVMKSPEPRAPAEAKAVPDDSPKELQDEKGDVAGTQKEVKEVATVGNTASGTSANTPYYKIKPKYPKAALQSGTEGWVLLTVDVNETGEVENVRVVDGEQRNLFGSEAKRAVQQWKYRPFVDASGHPFKKMDHQVRVDFKIEEATM